MAQDVRYQGTLTVHPALDQATVDSLPIESYAQVTDDGESIVIDRQLKEGTFEWWLDVLLEKLTAANRSVRGTVKASYYDYTGWFVVRDGGYEETLNEPTVTRRPPVKRRANPARRRPRL